MIDEQDVIVEKKFGGTIYNLKLDCKLNNDTKRSNIFVKLFAGVVIGFINGFWGGGGGMICVPLLMGVLKLPEKKAHATTLLIMLPLTMASIIVYFIGDNLPLLKSLNIGIGFVFGGLLGAILLKKISNIWLEIIFSIIIIAGGIKMAL